MLNAKVTMPEAYTGTTISIDGQTYDISENSVKTYFCEIGTYTRTVNDGDFGTLCLPWASVKLEGGIYYEVLGTKDPEQGVALVELGESDNLTAGKPYVFLATSAQIKVTYNPETEVAEEVVGNNIIGSFDGCNVPEGKYIIVNNLLYKTADATSTIAANRAYFDVDAMGVYTPSQAPGRKVVFMGGRTTPTDLETVDNAQCTMHNGKYIYKGRFVFVKDGKMYNALGM
ncbi:MAG: hypothetical protein KBT06_01355 [Prevotellaceae bacterium]|nr:hypothetical protein [Candidatus Colivivens equi]